MKRIPLILIIFIAVLAIEALGGDGPRVPMSEPAGVTEVPKVGFSHKVGTLWTMVTNYGKMGDEQYIDPNFEWPGGSGNIYGWRHSIWVGAMIKGAGTVSAADANKYVPQDTIHVTTRAQGGKSAEDTYTRYNDLNPPTPTGKHVNIGVEITEHTYAWDQSYNGDFIIGDYWIKNIGDDTTKDGIIDVKRTLTGVYIAFREDFDVSGFEGSSTDAALWSDDDRTGFDSLNNLCYMYDYNWGKYGYNDVGNPDPVTGVLRSPGYIGIRLLSADSSHLNANTKGRWTMFAPTARYNEPGTGDGPGQYNYISRNLFLQDTTARDYRVVSAIGPFTIPADDSIHIVIAYVVGYGLQGIIKNSQIAQNFFDGNYAKVPTAPDEPQFVLASSATGGIGEITIKWKNNSESSLDPLTGIADFDGYAVYRSSRQDAGGNAIWDTLAVYPKTFDPAKDTNWAGRPFLKSWPPPKIFENGDSLYALVDPGHPTGLIYTYAVTAFDKGDTSLGLGRLENQIGRGKPSTKVFMANAPPTTDLSKVRVVPNPFIGSSSLNNPNPNTTTPWVNRIQFINLPPGATVTIFTLAGDLVRVIHAGDVVYTNRDVTVTGDFTGVAEWDLTTKNNQETVSGVYIYVVESDAGKATGKFVLMR